MPEPADIPMQLAALTRMSPKQLRAKYLEVFGEPTRSGNRRFLIKRIAWRLQANAEGDLTQRMQRVRQRALQLARDSDLRTTAPRSRQATEPVVGARTVARPARFAAASELAPGTQLTRRYKGRTVVVTVLADGFEHAGVRYRSLSGAANAITGSHVSGRAFFGLIGKPTKELRA